MLGREPLAERGEGSGETSLGAEGYTEQGEVSGPRPSPLPQRGQKGAGVY